MVANHSGVQFNIMYIFLLSFMETLFAPYHMQIHPSYLETERVLKMRGRVDIFCQEDSPDSLVTIRSGIAVKHSS